MNGAPPWTPECPATHIQDEIVELDHGSGGRLTHRLIDTLFRPAFAQTPEDFTHDGAVLDCPGEKIAFTTDSYVVRPLFFPGGDIGSLAINGTVNDLTMCGAEPLFLSAGLVIEEGTGIEVIRQIVQSMSSSAAAAGVRLVTGDTKVVERGKGDGIYINTSGLGRVLVKSRIAPQAMEPGDVVLLSGDIGRHGIAILNARENLGFEVAIESDCAPLVQPVRTLIESGIDIHCMRDLTRGGLATALIELAGTARLSIDLRESDIPVSAPVRSACEILGLDPLYVANEGRFVLVLPDGDAQTALRVMQEFDAAATIIGEIRKPWGEAFGVEVETLGGRRVLDLPLHDQLPRIC